MSDIARQKVEPDMDEDLKQILKPLRLNGLLERWDEYLAAARQDHFSHERLLKHILQEEHRSSQEHARLLRRKRAKIPDLWEMITSSPGFVEWGDFLTNSSLTGALLDRLTATSHVFHLKGCVSLRPKLNARRDPS